MGRSAGGSGERGSYGYTHTYVVHQYTGKYAREHGRTHTNTHAHTQACTRTLILAQWPLALAALSSVVSCRFATQLLWSTRSCRGNSHDQGRTLNRKYHGPGLKLPLFLLLPAVSYRNDTFKSHEHTCMHTISRNPHSPIYTVHIS